jgi:hypothetical protein
MIAIRSSYGYLYHIWSANRTDKLQSAAKVNQATPSDVVVTAFGCDTPLTDVAPSVYRSDGTGLVISGKKRHGEMIRTAKVTVLNMRLPSLEMGLALIFSVERKLDPVKKC